MGWARASLPPQVFEVDPRTERDGGTFAGDWRGVKIGSISEKAESIGILPTGKNNKKKKKKKTTKKKKKKKKKKKTQKKKKKKQQTNNQKTRQKERVLSKNRYHCL